MPDSVHEEILDAVATRLAALDLGGAQNRLHRVWKLSGVWLANPPQFPCVVYSPDGNESPLDGWTGTDNWSYPVKIRVVDRIDGEQSPGLIATHLKWRKRIKRAFNNKHLSGITLGSVYWGRFLSSPMTEDVSGAFDLLVEPLNFEFYAREVRT